MNNSLRNQTLERMKNKKSDDLNYHKSTSVRRLSPTTAPLQRQPFLQRFLKELNHMAAIDDATTLWLLSFLGR
jgi:hypothetical protein